MEMQKTMEGLREEMQIEREKGGLRFEEESVDKNEESGRLNAPPLYLLPRDFQHSIVQSILCTIFDGGIHRGESLH